MAQFLKVNGQEHPVTHISKYQDASWGGRSTQTLFLTMSHDEAAALLPSGTPWSIVQRDTVDKLDEEGQPTGETEVVVTETDMSEYCLAGEITDYRDGSVSVKMGKRTETESAVGAMVALTGEVVTVERATELRPVIEQASASLSDSDAAKAVELFPKWEYPVSYSVSDRAADGGKLYKCQQAHTSQADWPPHLTPALWVVVDVTHAGTQDDPIPASRGMEYEYGKYYLDSEDGKTYKCERIGEAAGGKIVLQYLPHELVGNYFTAV